MWDSRLGLADRAGNEDSGWMISPTAWAGLNLPEVVTLANERRHAVEAASSLSRQSSARDMTHGWYVASVIKRSRVRPSV